MVFLVLVKEYERVTHSETESNRQKNFCADYQARKVEGIRGEDIFTLHKISQMGMGYGQNEDLTLFLG